METHIHEIMGMIAAANPPIARTKLIEAIEETFPESTFRSCSKGGMDPASAVEFMEARGKFYVNEKNEVIFGGRQGVCGCQSAQPVTKEEDTMD